MIFLNRELRFPTIQFNKRLALLALGLTALAIVVISALFINWRLSQGSIGSQRSAASEEASESALGGSHNECENLACVAKNGIGPNDCVSNLDCQAVECSNVVSEPAKPVVGASNVTFTCQGQIGNSNATINKVVFKLEGPTSAAEEYECPSNACVLIPSSGSYTARLTYPKALTRGTYKVMTKTCFKLFSPSEICSDYQIPTGN